MDGCSNDAGHVKSLDVMGFNTILVVLSDIIVMDANVLQRMCEF